jgi:hypothetical protein
LLKVTSKNFFYAADSRIKDLMQSLQSQQAALAQTERVKEELFTPTKENLFLHTKENQENVPADAQPAPSHHFGLASLLMRAKDLQQQQQREGEEEEEEGAVALEEEEEILDEEEEEEEEEEEALVAPPKKPQEEEDEEEEEEDMEAEEGDVPQIAIKPLEVVHAASKPLELSMPPPTNEISAQ